MDSLLKAKHIVLFVISSKPIFAGESSPAFFYMNKFWEFIRKNIILCLIAIVGLGFDIASVWGEHPATWLKIAGQIGQLFAVGGVFSFLLTYEGFTSAFQDALQKVIYTSAILQHRDDISDIWSMVSKEVFNRKFPAIQDPLLDIITKEYFPSTDTNCYYYNIKQVYKITVKDKDNGVIDIEERRTLTLRADNTKEFHYIMQNQTKMKESKDNIDDYFTHHHFIVNGDRRENVCSITKEGETGFMKYDVTLKDETSYSIDQRFSHLQDLDDDNFICFRAKYLIQNMDIELIYDSQDIIVDFYANGTINSFENIIDEEGHKRFTYDGLVLNKQGYVVTLRCK